MKKKVCILLLVFLPIMFIGEGCKTVVKRSTGTNIINKQQKTVKRKHKKLYKKANH